MKVVTADEMRTIDRIAIDDYGIPGPVLMERAGLAVAVRVRELHKGKKVTVLCGGGNNGGDGLVAARNLFNWGFTVSAIIFAKKDALSPDCASQYRIAKKMGVPVEFRKALTQRDLHGAVIVDAVFGTGLSRPVAPDIASAFAFVNGSGAPVVAVDIPSGVSSDTGEVLGEAIRADCTVTFGLPKRGHLLYPGADYAGRLFVEDIGFPVSLLHADSLSVETVDRGLVSGMLPIRHKDSYKGDYGHVLVIAGSRGKTGAALMTARACLRSGAGLVTLGVPESIAGIIQAGVTEEMVLPLPDDGAGMLSAGALDPVFAFITKKADVIAIGPGMGTSPDTETLMAELVRRATAPMVIDADGLNSLKGKKDIVKAAKAPLVLTPHPGEMARLLQHDAIEDRIGTASAFSRETGAYLVLKGVPTVTASPEGQVFLNTSGNPGMATGGSGDVLTGVIAALLGQSMSPIEASVCGVFLHGLAGDRAAEAKGMQGLIASDIIAALPEAFMVLDGR